jgi:hypothetical protein
MAYATSTEKNTQAYPEHQGNLVPLWRLAFLNHLHAVRSSENRGARDDFADIVTA